VEVGRDVALFIELLHIQGWMVNPAYPYEAVTSLRKIDESKERIEMSTVTTTHTENPKARIDPPANSEFQKIAEDVLHGLQYSFLAAACSQDPFAAGSIEENFRLGIATRQPERRAAYQTKAQEIANGSVPTRQSTFGRYAALEVVEYGRLGYVAGSAKLPALQLNSAKLLEGLKVGAGPSAPTGIVSSPAGHTGVHPSSAPRSSSIVNSITFYITEVRCIDETDPEIGTDEIAMGGMAVDESGNTFKIDSFTVSNNFTEDDTPVVFYPTPGKAFCSFDLTKATSWPKNYAAIVFLAEVNWGGFASALTDAWQAAAPAIKQKIEDALTAAGATFGAIGAVIGKVLGKILAWVLDKLVGWIIALFQDDIFSPGTALVSLDSGSGDSYLTDPDWNINEYKNHFHLSGTGGQFDFQGFGGEYLVKCYWQADLTEDPRGPRHYIGAFRAGTDPYAFWVSDWTRFHTKWNELSSAGLRLVDLETFFDGTTRLYAGVFRAGTDAHALWIGAEWDSFKAEWQKLSRAGLRLTTLQTYFEGSRRLYDGVFRAGTDPYALWVGLDWPAFVEKWKASSQSGLRLVNVSTYSEAGKQLFNGVFRAGTDAHALWTSDWVGFTARWKELSQEGLRLIDVDTYLENGTRMFVGAFRGGTDGYLLWNGDWTSFLNKWDEASQEGLRLVNVASY
jgi:Bacterial tandem repeat domain 1